MKFTEEQVKKMASPISQSEDEKCKNAIHMVRDAMKLLDYTDDGKAIRSYQADTYSYTLDLRHRGSDRRITLLVQGSYANKTNIPSESDVDVAVILESSFMPTYRDGVSREDYNFTEGTFTVESLKDDVEYALKKHFNYTGVVRHNKCIKVSGNTYRVDADVVPAYRYRDYSKDFKFDANNYTGGIFIIPDYGEPIINYPERHIKNDIEKNSLTKYNFKKCVRIAKSLKEKMLNCGYLIPDSISSFGLESLIWNVENSAFTKYASILRFSFDEVLKSLCHDFDSFRLYKEANGIKPLFSGSEEIGIYQNFITEMNSFFEYDI